jgi:hypothetical protein
VLKLKYKNKHIKILILSVIFFILGLILFIRSFFSLQNQLKPAKVHLSPSGYTSTNLERIVSPEPIVLNSNPSPDNFLTFNIPDYKSDLTLKINCKADYYVLLIFPKSVDYRKNPNLSVYNKAYECNGKKEFFITINLNELNLTQGSYYFVRANQNLQGSWYDPY